MELEGLIAKINELAPESEIAPIIKTAKQKAVNLGLAEIDESGALIPKSGTLKDVELLRRSISDSINGADATSVKFGTVLKEALDEGTAGKGGELYKAARSMYQDYAGTFKNFGLARDILSTKAGTNDRRIAVENIFNKSIMTSTNDDVVALKNILSKSDEGKQAWNELRGATIRHIRDESIKGVARDERGNPIISPAQIERVVSSLDKSGKLNTIFGEKGAEQIRTINDVAKVLFTSPPGAVNTSNTASVILAAMDMAISGMAGMPAPILSAIKMVQKNIKDAKVKARVAKALERTLPMEKKIVDIKPSANNF